MKFAIFHYLVACCLLFVAVTTRAASQSLYFSVPTSSIGVGSEFPVKILIDSDQPLNAYAIALLYASDRLAILGFDNSKSVIDIWQGQPAVSEGGPVNFRGGSITPFEGSGGNIITVRFRAVKEGEALLAFGKSSLYLANGKGTKVIPQTAGLKFQILPLGAATATSVSTPQIYEGAQDIAPPAIKYLSLIQDPFNNDQKLLSFMVSDPDSGVKETLVRTRSLLFWSDWLPAQNPTAVPLSVWSVGFKALDNKGNASERTLYNFSAFLQPEALVIAAILVIFIYILVLIIPKLKKGR